MIFVCDFDNTLVDDNSDTFVHPPEMEKELETLRDEYEDWRDFVQASMDLMHAKGLRKVDIDARLKQITLDPHLHSTIRAIAKHGCDIHIVSDANETFIDSILTQHDLRDCFDRVMTNPSAYDSETGRLVIRPYHDHKTLGPHGCAMCHTKNMCKGKIMREKILVQQNDNTVARPIYCYVGDGSNE